jgi:hypothetical protein
MYVMIATRPNSQGLNSCIGHKDNIGRPQKEYYVIYKEQRGYKMKQ